MPKSENLRFGPSRISGIYLVGHGVDILRADVAQIGGRQAACAMPPSIPAIGATRRMFLLGISQGAACKHQQLSNGDLEAYVAAHSHENG